MRLPGNTRGGGYLVDLSFIVLGFLVLLPFAKEVCEPGFICLAMRTAHFLAWFSLGRIYRDFLEHRFKRVRPIWLVGVYLLLECAIALVTSGSAEVIISWVKLPAGIWSILWMLDGLLGFLLLGRVLEPVARRSRTVAYLSKNTFAIMCHHLLGFFILMSIPAFISSRTLWFNTLDMTKYLTIFNYLWFPKQRTEFCWFYVAFGIVFAVWFQRQIDHLWDLAKNSRSAAIIRRALQSD